MKNTRLIATALAIAIMILAYFMVMSVRKTRDIFVAPQGKIAAEKVKEPVIYSIPENRIPSVEEIEKKIAESEARDNARKEDGLKIPKEKLRARPAEEAPIEAAAESAVRPIPKTPPEKKEVKFPTYEERQKRQTQSGIVAY